LSSEGPCNAERGELRKFLYDGFMDDRNAPATKGDLEDFKVEVNTRFQLFEHRMEQHLSEMEGRIITTICRLGESCNTAYRL